MPQFVKGGENVFGWSIVSNTGDIAIPNKRVSIVITFLVIILRFDFKS